MSSNPALLKVAPAATCALRLPVPLQVEPAVLLLVSTRGPSRNFVPAPLIASTPPAPTVVVPVPLIVPPDQFSVPLAVTVPVPARIPPERFSTPRSKAELTVTVPPAIFAVFPAALMVPPFAFSVAVPRLIAPPPTLSESGFSTRFS